MRLALVTLVLVLASGCRHHFPLPYTVHQLRADSPKWPGEALVHYLAQPNADVAVCTLAPPPAITRTDDTLIEPFVDSLESQALTPDRWQACASRLVPALPATQQELTWLRLARSVRELFDVGELAAPRLIAAHEVIAARSRTASPALTELLGKLSTRSRDSVAPQLVPLLDTYLGTLELDTGRLAGKVVTADDIANTQDEGLLLRMSLRLPDDALRTQARRKLIRQRIERSPTPEVKARAPEVELAVLQTGRWAQPAATLKLERPELPAPLPFLALVRQDVGRQVVSLLTYGANRAEVAPLIDLTQRVRFPVGWSRPLGLCEPAAALSVEPCVDAHEVEVASPDVSFDAEGLVRLPEQLSMERAVELARTDEGLVLPVRLAGRLVSSLQVPLRFEAPGSIVFEADRGEPGPAVNVVVQPTPSALLINAVSQTGERKLVVVPRDVLPGRFEVVSLGGQGYDGRNGRDGADGAKGYNGESASCPYTVGQPGGRGGDGGHGDDGVAGGAGGDGGAVNVVLQCNGRCEADEQWVRSLVHSRGGAGGDGGSGGRGGDGGEGGRGGFSTNCTVNGHAEFLRGGSNGARGRDGSKGAAGEDGEPGQPGPVQVVVQ